jgi:hypothetical protein
MGELVQQTPGWVVVRQSYREPGGVGQSAASLARKTLAPWRKSQAHVGPDGVYHALRMCECDQARVVRDDEALLPCIDATALPIAAVYQGSRALPVLPTGRLVNAISGRKTVPEGAVHSHTAQRSGRNKPDRGISERAIDNLMLHQDECSTGRALGSDAVGPHGAVDDMEQVTGEGRIGLETEEHVGGLPRIL